MTAFEFVFPRFGLLLILAAFASDRRVILATTAILIIAHGVLLIISQAP